MNEKQQYICEALTKNDFFKGITLEGVWRLIKDGHYRLRRYAKDEHIAAEGEPCQELIVVISGSIRGEMFSESRKMLKIEDIAPFESAAPAFLFGPINTLPVTITANESAELLFIPKAELKQMMLQNETLLDNFLYTISARTQQPAEKIRFYQLKSLKGKIAHYILHRLKNDSYALISGGRQQTANYFGVTRPALSRAISEMEKEGLIKIAGKKAFVLQKEKLKSQIY